MIDLVSFDDALKRALHHRAAHPELYANIDRGELTPARRQRLVLLKAEIDRTLYGHDDHTGAACRVDVKAHDCCYTCNVVGDVLRLVEQDDYWTGPGPVLPVDRFDPLPVVPDDEPMTAPPLDGLASSGLLRMLSRKP